MNVGLFSAALDTVEQDHQLVLDRVEALKKLVIALLSPENLDLSQVLDQLRQTDNYFTTQFLVHMDEEEKTLFPLLEQMAPGGPALAERLRGEHATLRRKLEEFGNCLGVALQLQDRPPRAVLRDLVTYAWDLWDDLDRHAHAETRAIQECLEEALREDAPPT